MVNRISYFSHLYSLWKLKKKVRFFLEKIIFFVVAFGMILTFPQAYTIIILWGKEGVSLITWWTYLIINMIWLLYGYFHMDKIIFMNNFLWCMIDVIIVWGLIIRYLYLFSCLSSVSITIKTNIYFPYFYIWTRKLLPMAIQPRNPHIAPMGNVVIRDDDSGSGYPYAL